MGDLKKTVIVFTYGESWTPTNHHHFSKRSNEITNVLTLTPSLVMNNITDEYGNEIDDEDYADYSGNAFDNINNAREFFESIISNAMTEQTGADLDELPPSNHDILKILNHFDELIARMNATSKSLYNAQAIENGSVCI